MRLRCEFDEFMEMSPLDSSNIVCLLAAYSTKECFKECNADEGETTLFWSEGAPPFMMATVGAPVHWLDDEAYSESPIP